MIVAIIRKCATREEKRREEENKLFIVVFLSNHLTLISVEDHQLTIEATAAEAQQRQLCNFGQ